MKLGELANIHVGLVLRRKEAKTNLETKQEYTVITSRAFGDDGRLIKDSLQKYRSKEELDDQYLTKKGDIIMRLTHPYRAIHIDSDRYLDIVIPSIFAVIRLKEGSKLSADYLVTLINSATVGRFLKREELGVVTPMIKLNVLEVLDIPLVSLEQQKAIVELQNLYQQKSRLLEELLKLENTYYQSAMKTFWENPKAL